MTPEDRLALARRLWQWEPHPGQYQLLTARLADGTEPRTLVACCGRRWGKTEALGCDIATRLLTDADLAQLIVAPTEDQAALLFDSVEEKIAWIRDDVALCAEFPQVKTWEIRRSPYPHIRRKTDGAQILSARSAGRQGRSLRGRGTTRRVRRFRVIVDEAAWVPDEAIEQALRPMLATVPNGGGQMALISSPRGRQGAFYRAFVRGEREEGTARSVRLPSEQNPLIEAEFLDEMRATLSDRAFRAEFGAEFLDSAGAVFVEADLVAAICPDDYGALPLAGITYIAGVDFGRRGDYTVVAVCEARPDGVRLVALARMRGLSWDAQVTKVSDVLEHWNVRDVVCDRTGVGDAVTEQLGQEVLRRRLRARILEFVFTSASKPPLLDGLAIALGRGRVRFPAHPTLLSEMRHFEIVGGPSDRPKMAARGDGNPESEHDDCVCALALAFHAARPYLMASGTGRIVTAGPARGGFNYPTNRKDLEFSWYPPFSTGVHARKWARRQATALMIRIYAFVPARAVGASLQRLRSRLPRRRSAGKA